MDSRIGALIMSYKYVKAAWPETGNDTGQIKRKADNAHIPFDEGNTDYQEYKEWLDAGNTPEASD